jgi:oligopeptide transport system substrate-binding protein
VDPAKATGQPENRILNALFEGLLRMMPPDGQTPDADGLVPLVASPAAAEMPEISSDGKTYTFRIRDSARWSNGAPVTAADFAWSWRRILHPETAAEYAYQLYYIRGAKAYNQGIVAPRM